MNHPTWDLILAAWKNAALRSHPPGGVAPIPDDAVFELQRTLWSGVEFGYNPDTDSITFAWQTIDGIDLDVEDFLRELENAAS